MITIVAYACIEVVRLTQATLTLNFIPHNRMQSMKQLRWLQCSEQIKAILEQSELSYNIPANHSFLKGVTHFSEFLKYKKNRSNSFFWKF